MNLLTKLLNLFKPTPTPAAPAANIHEAEFLEAVAKPWRERYQPQPPQHEANARSTSQNQAA